MKFKSPSMAPDYYLFFKGAYWTIFFPTLLVSTLLTVYAFEYSSLLHEVQTQASRIQSGFAPYRLAFNQNQNEPVRTDFDQSDLEIASNFFEIASMTYAEDRAIMTWKDQTLEQDFKLAFYSKGMLESLNKKSIVKTSQVTNGIYIGAGLWQDLGLDKNEKVSVEFNGEVFSVQGTITFYDVETFENESILLPMQFMHIFGTENQFRSSRLMLNPSDVHNAQKLSQFLSLLSLNGQNYASRLEISPPARLSGKTAKLEKKIIPIEWFLLSCLITLIGMIYFFIEQMIVKNPNIFFMRILASGNLRITYQSFIKLFLYKLSREWISGFAIGTCLYFLFRWIHGAPTVFLFPRGFLFWISLPLLTLFSTYSTWKTLQDNLNWSRIFR